MGVALEQEINYSESNMASSVCALCLARALTDILAFAPSVSSARRLVPKTFLRNED
jgi:hypothetical protein